MHSIRSERLIWIAEILIQVVFYSLLFSPASVCALCADVIGKRFCQSFPGRNLNKSNWPKQQEKNTFMEIIASCKLYGWYKTQDTSGGLCEMFFRRSHIVQLLQGVEGSRESEELNWNVGREHLCCCVAMLLWGTSWLCRNHSTSYWSTS